MKAITLHQPWASFLAYGIKTVETRSWETLHRGEIAIHAAATMPAYAREFCTQKWVQQLLNDILHTVNDLPLGKVVAVGHLRKCWPTQSIAVRLGGGAAPIPIDPSAIVISPREYHLGNYHPGRFTWIFSKINRLYRPIPARGAQRIWNWDAPGIRADEHAVTFRMAGY